MALDLLDHDTRALYERVRGASGNRELHAALEGDPDERVGPLGVRVVLVPGIFYRDHPETGADGALLREVCEHLGIPFDIVPVDGTEGLDVAADVIHEVLTRLPGAEPVLLFSLSKGSAEVRHALAQDCGQAPFRRVRAWVSVSGLPFGSPAAERLLRRPLSWVIFRIWFWRKGWRFDTVREVLRHRPHAPFRLPAHLCFVQIAAFPLQIHLRDRRSRRLRRLLADLGPNDGFAPLRELAGLPGLFYPVWGADHYLHGAPDLQEQLARLIQFLSGWSSNAGPLPSSDSVECSVGCASR